MLMAISEYEVVRIVAEVITIIGGVGTVFVVLLKNLWKSHRLQEENTRETHSLKDQLTKMNGSVAAHSALDDKRFGELAKGIETAALLAASSQIKLIERLARIEGRMGLAPMEKEKE